MGDAFQLVTFGRRKQKLREPTGQAKQGQVQELFRQDQGPGVRVWDKAEGQPWEASGSEWDLHSQIVLLKEAWGGVSHSRPT